MGRGFSLSLLLVVGLSSPAFAADGPPAWSEIKQAVDRYFAAKANYVAGDLLTHGDVQPLLEQLKNQGLQIGQIAVGFDPFVPDSHALAQLLKSSQGRPIMRKVAQISHAYDRLDRLSWFPAGQQLLKKAFHDREPLKAIEALVSDASASELERRFKDEPLAANFTTDSGRIYTQADLLEYLKTAYRLETNGLSMPGR